MDELYKISDNLLKELKRIKDSGLTDRRVQEYKYRIMDYLEDKLRGI